MTSFDRISTATFVLVGLAAFSQYASAAPPPGRTVAPTIEFIAQSALRSDPVVFDNGNIYTVYTQPTATPIVRLQRRTRVTAITTYHWNDGQGAEPGYIGLVDANGLVYGPWAADGSPGQGGVRDAYWTVRPNLTLPPGRYIVLDSDLASWAHNEATGGAGMVHIEGRVR
jgi:hypothetical protein